MGIGVVAPVPCRYGVEDPLLFCVAITDASLREASAYNLLYILIPPLRGLPFRVAERSGFERQIQLIEQSLMGICGFLSRGKGDWSHGGSSDVCMY